MRLLNRKIVKWIPIIGAIDFCIHSKRYDLEKEGEGFVYYQMGIMAWLFVGLGLAALYWSSHWQG